MSEVFVKSFTHLKDRPGSDRALPMLQRIASLVKPIMRKHGWVLPVLAEFFPDDPHLVGLNVNGGEKILLRLRPPHSPNSFYDEEQVVQVMLHELTHNVHGPHDDKFYNFLAGLEEEYQALKRSGYSGEGFFSDGHRLGIGVSHNVPPHMARVKALEAAEKRRQKATLMGSGGRLGGSTHTRGLSPRELAAQAAERRARDEKTCGSAAVAQREADKAAKESIESKAIDLITESDKDVIDGPPSAAGPPKTATSHSRQQGASTSIPKQPGKQWNKPLISLEHTRSLPDEALQWACPVCTLLNEQRALTCDACLTPRPKNRDEGWVCMICGETGISHEFWSCRFCGTIKAKS